MSFLSIYVEREFGPVFAITQTWADFRLDTCGFVLQILSVYFILWRLGWFKFIILWRLGCCNSMCHHGLNGSVSDCLGKILGQQWYKISWTRFGDREGGSRLGHMRLTKKPHWWLPVHVQSRGLTGLTSKANKYGSFLGLSQCGKVARGGKLRGFTQKASSRRFLLGLTWGSTAAGERLNRPTKKASDCGFGWISLSLFERRYLLLFTSILEQFSFYLTCFCMLYLHYSILGV